MANIEITGEEIEAIVRQEEKFKARIADLETQNKMLMKNLNMTEADGVSEIEAYMDALREILESKGYVTPNIDRLLKNSALAGDFYEERCASLKRDITAAEERAESELDSSRDELRDAEKQLDDAVARVEELEATLARYRHVLDDLDIDDRDIEMVQNSIRPAEILLAFSNQD